MNEFFKKLDIIDAFNTQIDIHQIDFRSKLQEQVKESRLGIFSDAFDAFTFGKKKFRGNIDSQGFKIKKRQRLFKANLCDAIAYGTYSQQGNTLSIETEIKSSSTIKATFIAIIALYILVIAGLSLPYFRERREINVDYRVILFIFLHGIFMFFIIRLFMRKSVKIMKQEFSEMFSVMTQEKKGV